MPYDTIVSLTLYAAVGACAGVLAGLLGVGGGLIIVPMLSFLFAAQHLPAETILHLSLGTSLASIMFTSLSSMRAHHLRGAVEWRMVGRITPGILVGSLFGSWVAAQLSTRMLKWFFVCFLFYVAVKMLRSAAPRAGKTIGRGVVMAVGGVIGCISSLVGIGGGTMSVPFMLRCNVSIHSAIGTSAAIGFPIAVAGAGGYLLNGLSATRTLPYSVGYIYVPALICIALASILTAPVGARLAHALPVSRLKKIFAGLLIVLGLKMLISLV